MGAGAFEVGRLASYAWPEPASDDRDMICVTGGSGFIGTKLCELFQRQGVKYKSLDRAAREDDTRHSHRVNICDLEQLRGALTGAAIVHLAAEHRDDVRPLSLYEEVNVEGTRNVCRIAEERGVDRIIFASSVAVYGFAPPETGEDGAINPFNEYGRTKYQAECILREWQAAAPEKRSLTIVRPTVVFGPGNRGNVYNLLRQIESGAFLMIGAGENRKSMAYADNLVAFLAFALRFGPGFHIYNYVDKPDLMMKELVSLVRWKVRGKGGVGPSVPRWMGIGLGRCSDVLAWLIGRRLPMSSIRVMKFLATTTFSSAAHRVDGFVAPVPLEEGLAITLEREFVKRPEVGELTSQMRIRPWS